MKKIIFIFLCGLSLTACASLAPNPTTPPAVLTPASAPTFAPRTPTPSTALDVKNINQGKQPNGDVVTTANITQQNLGVGQIELSHPDTMIVGESRNLRLRLSPAPQLVTSKKETTTKPQANSPNFVFKFSGNVDLYPVMIAHLTATTFDVSPGGPQQQVVDTSAPVTWVWSVKAREPGRQELALLIAIPAVVNGAESQLSRNLQDMSIVIVVQPAPSSLWDQIGKSIANNSGAIVVALIGLLGTILGIIIKLRADKAEGKKKS